MSTEIVLIDSPLGSDQVALSRTPSGLLAVSCHEPGNADPILVAVPAGAMMVGILTVVPDEERAQLVNYINGLMHPGPK